MSEFGEDIDVILIKDGRDWTIEESKKIEALVSKGQRLKLSMVRNSLRTGKIPPSTEDLTRYEASITKLFNTISEANDKD